MFVHRCFRRSRHFFTEILVSFPEVCLMALGHFFCLFELLELVVPVYRYLLWIFIIFLQDW